MTSTVEGSGMATNPVGRIASGCREYSQDNALHPRIHGPSNHGVNRLAEILEEHHVPLVDFDLAEQ